MSEFAPIPLPPEDNEELLVSGLIVLLQFHRENAANLQQSQLNAHMEAGQPLRAANYVVDSLKEDGKHIRIQHTRVVFGPQYKQPLRHNVAQLVVRYPEVSDEATGDFVRVPNDGLFWNDVFLEARTVDGHAQDYLLNSKGLTAFENAQSDVETDEAFYQTGDLFTARTGTHDKGLLTLEILNELLPIHAASLNYEAYAYQLQPSDEELPPYYSGLDDTA